MGSDDRSDRRIKHYKINTMGNKYYSPAADEHFNFAVRGRQLFRGITSGRGGMLYNGS